MAELTRCTVCIGGELGEDPSGDVLCVADVIDCLEDLAALDPEACYAGVNNLLVELRAGGKRS